MYSTKYEVSRRKSKKLKSRNFPFCLMWRGVPSGTHNRTESGHFRDYETSSFLFGPFQPNQKLSVGDEANDWPIESSPISGVALQA